MGEDLLLLSAVDEADGFTAVGVELMHVLRYICVNLIAVRKICRKHDQLLMNRMLGGYYHHLKILAAVEANGKWKKGGTNEKSPQQLLQTPNLQSFQDEHVQNAQTLGGLLARESDDIFEPNHPRCYWPNEQQSQASRSLRRQSTAASKFQDSSSDFDLPCPRLVRV